MSIKPVPYIIYRCSFDKIYIANICNINNKEILIDGSICSDFEALPKCKHCKNFTEPDENGMGICTGFADNAWTFGELKVTTCEKYDFR